MPASQPGILAAQTDFARSVSLSLVAGADTNAALRLLAQDFDPAWGVLGIGQPFAAALGIEIPGLRAFTTQSAIGPDGFVSPTTQADLWLLQRAGDRSGIVDISHRLETLIAGCFRVSDALDLFLYRDGRDLSGYEDGTENPKGEAAVAVALSDAGPGLDGSSFVAIQRWRHDLAAFQSYAPAERDRMIGRERESNDELEDAPAYSHVKRTAQEDFEPPAFMLRRSLPWTRGTEQGLEFIAFGRTLDAFEASLRRMSGAEDGIVDALARFSRPITGGYYWCPPLISGRLDLSALSR